jgi:DNA-binding CsgD family transcriptional regulator
MASLSSISSGADVGPMGYFGPETHLVKCNGGYPKCHKWKFMQHKLCPACRYAFACRERPLTERQKAVIGLYASGLTIKEIGHELKVSPKTIEFHIAVCRRKLKVKASVFLVHYALKNNLVPNHFTT